jgi:signal transduction histidine kinase
MSPGLIHSGQALLDMSDLRHYEWLQVPMWVFDPEQMCVRWANQAGVDFWRAESLQALLARDFSDASVASRSRLLASLQQHAGGRVLRESWTLYPMGQPLTTALLSRGVRLPDGRQAIFFCSEPLAASYDADMLRGIEALQHTPVRVALYRLDSTLLVMRNPAAVAAFGPVNDNPDEHEVVHALFEQRQDADHMLDAVRQHGGHAGEALLRTLAGPCWHAIDARAVRDPVSGHTMVLINARDISDLKAALTALEAARDAAEAANRAKSSFLANMSHEIRTPMNGVLGLTGMVLNTTLDDRQRRFLEMAHGSAQALMQIINDLLDISKIEADKLTLQPERVLLADTLRLAMAPLAVQAEQRGLNLNWHIDERLPTSVVLDALRWRQVLLNLAGNALKFTSEGGIDVRIKGLRDDDGQMWLSCAVHDTGIGMSDSQLADIFEPFVQADDSITRRYGGTGLGLAIAHRLVQLMGGQIEVESAPGRGSCFRFVVPVGLPAE